MPMHDDPETGFPALLQELLPRLQSYATILLGQGDRSDALLQSSVAVTAARHLLAAAARADAARAMSDAVAAVLGAWLDQAPGVPAQLGQAVRELFDELTDAAVRAHAEGQTDAAAALGAAAAELEWAHGWLWLRPTLPAPPAQARAELIAG